MYKTDKHLNIKKVYTPQCETQTCNRKYTKYSGRIFPLFSLRQLIEKARPSEVVFSIFGIREGLLFSYLSPIEQAKDPLTAFCEDFARLRSRSTKYAHELCRWTDKLFDRVGIDETIEERRLRHCACLISDVEWRAQPITVEGRGTMF